ncbi:unnamed protein product, partial [Ixodes pacificus]
RRRLAATVSEACWSHDRSSRPRRRSHAPSKDAQGAVYVGAEGDGAAPDSRAADPADGAGVGNIYAHACHAVQKPPSGPFVLADEGAAAVALRRCDDGVSKTPGRPNLRSFFNEPFSRLHRATLPVTISWARTLCELDPR